MGFHRRLLEVLNALGELGVRITLAGVSSGDWSGSGWEGVTTASPDLYKGHWSDRYAVAFAVRWDRLRGRRDRLPPLAERWSASPPAMWWWFRHLVARERPTLVLVNHVYWADLPSRLRQRRYVRVLDIIDVMSAQVAMRALLDEAMPSRPVSSQTNARRALEESFFDVVPTDPARWELHKYSRYDLVLAITEDEAQAISRLSPRQRVAAVPMTASVSSQPSSYDGGALFPAGPNPFNVQGYLYFIQRVFPLLADEVPDFVLDVTGASCDDIAPEPGVVLHGLLPDLETLYAHARMAICPLIGGTGQKVKIVDAMAHGVPTVTLAHGARGSPIEHERNGFVARDANEFAHYVRLLWRDQELCVTLGAAARETIDRDFSPSNLAGRLRRLLFDPDDDRGFSH